MKTSAIAPTLLWGVWGGSTHLPYCGPSGKTRSVPKICRVRPFCSQAYRISQAALFNPRSKPQPTLAEFTYTVENCVQRYITHLSDFFILLNVTSRYSNV